MKTSNIILTSIIGSITLLIVTGFMQLRLAGEMKSYYAEQVFADINLSEFKYLVIKESVNLTISPSNEIKMTIQNAKGQDSPKVRHHQRGDTLFIDLITLDPNESLFVNIKTPVENLQWIKAENATFSLTDFPATDLDIDLNHSRLRIHAENVEMGTLTITGVNDSNINAYGGKIDSLHLRLDESDATVPMKINSLKGYMVNNSSLFARDVGNFEFKKDSTCRFY